jgi:membrane fusion protein (multidrug efflux system)
MSTTAAPTTRPTEATPTTPPAAPVAAAPTRSRRAIVLPIVVLLAIVALVYGGERWMYARAHQSTDNAQVDGHIVPLLAKVGGYVTAVSAARTSR